MLTVSRSWQVCKSPPCPRRRGRRPLDLGRPVTTAGVLGLADLVLARDTTQLRRLAPRHPRVHLVPDGVDSQTWDAAFDAASRLVDDVVGARHAGSDWGPRTSSRRRAYSPQLAPPPDPGDRIRRGRRW